MEIKGGDKQKIDPAVFGVVFAVDYTDVIGMRASRSTSRTSWLGSFTLTTHSELSRIRRF